MQQSDRRYAILGSGALGGYYGCLLARGGKQVDFLCRSDAAHIRKHGWTVESKDGDFRLANVRAFGDVREMPKADVAVVALKTTSNDALPSLLADILSDRGVVLVLQNGLGNEDRVARIVGADRVIGGSCFLCSNKVGPGHIHHLDYGTIAMGEHSADGRPAGVTERLQQIAKDFEEAGVPVQLSPDLKEVRWKKLVWNIPFNGLSVILDATTSELVGDPGLRQSVRAIMEEIVRAGADLGVPIEDAFLDSMIANTEKMTPYKTSMKVDYDTKRPLEIESIFGEPLRQGEQAGVSMPVIRSMYHELLFLDRRNRGE